MHKHQNEIIASAEARSRLQSVMADIQYEISHYTEQEQSHLAIVLDEIDASKVNEIKQLVIQSAQEKASMRELIARLIDYVLPRPVATPMALVAESPYVMGQVLLEQFGTFSPSQHEFIQWQQREMAWHQLKCACRQFLLNLIRGRTP